MLKKLSLSVVALATVAGLLPVGEACAQTIRQEGRLEARAARQAGRANARTYGDFGNQAYTGYYAPGYYGPSYGTGGYYGGPGYYGGAGYGNGYYGAPGYYGGTPYGGFARPGYGGNYAGPVYNRAYGPGAAYANGPSYGPSVVARRAYLGVTMSETADGVVRVSSVRPNSPADEAGIRPGDVLLTMDGREIYAAQDVTRMVARHVPGEAVRLDIDRNGQSDTLEAVLAAPPGQLVVRPVPRASYPAEYPVDRSQYPAYVEPYEIMPAPMQARRVPNPYFNAY